MGVMRHLADFLRMLSVPCRVSYLPLLHDILHSTNLLNWRLRQCLAVQLPALLLLPPPELVFNTLFTLVMTLLQDPVASVRKGSFLGVAKMVQILSKQSDYVTSLYNEIQDKDNCGETVSPTGSADSVEFPLDFHNEGYQRKKSYKRQYHNIAVTAAHHVDIVSNAIQTLVQGKSYHLRQLWAELAHALLLELPQSLFEKHFLDGLLYLASDPVSNVRVAVAAVLAGWESYDPLGTSSADTTKGGSTINVGGKNDESNNDSSNNNSNSEVSHLIVDDRIISNCPLILNPTSPWSWLLKRLDVAQCIMRLSGDDKDVYQEIHKLQPIFPEIIFRVVSCKGMKVAPGGQNPVWNMYEVTESQLATCEASPATHLSDGCSSSSDDGECGRGNDKEYHYTASSEDDECSSRSYKRILNQNFNHNQSFSELPIESKDGDKDLLLPLESKILNQKEIPIAANTKMGRSCDTRISRYAITVADYEFADNQQALADRDSSEHIGTSNYMGCPANLKNSGDALGQGLRLASPVRDMSHGFVVRSPVRKVEATAVLLQQQKEEREEERLIHLKTKRILSMECDDNDLSENEINGIHGNFDSHISKVVLQQESPNLRRRMTTHSIFEQTTYDDSDDDESSNDLTDISVDRISLSSTYSESRHINVLPSLHFVTSQQSAVSKTHEYAIPDSSDCSGHFGDIDILGHFERETPSSSSSSRNPNQTESSHLPQEIFFSDQILSLEQCDVMTSNSNTFFLSQQPLERITGSVAQETIKIDNLHNVATTIDLGNIGPV